jgi:predicted alpha/beta-fold hydrolase
MYNVAGTHSMNDWGTNAMLAIGKLKNTKRYKEADETLKKAQEKYKPTNTAITGHSLGGAIAQNFHNRGSVTTLDPAYTIGQKTRGEAFRSKGDLVSLLGSKATHMKTLDHNTSNSLQAHNVSNIKDENIYV